MIDLLVGLMLGFGVHSAIFPPKPPIEVVKEVIKTEYCGHCIGTGSKIEIANGLQLEVEWANENMIHGKNWFIVREDFQRVNIFESVDRPGCFYQKKKVSK